MTIILNPGKVTLNELESVYWDGKTSKLHHDTHLTIKKGAALIAEIAAGSEPVYGINTGFGKLASIKIDINDVTILQRNLILSHCCGVGAPLPENVVRLMMTLKLIALGRGASGVRLELVHLLEKMLANRVIPVIPEKGSVGASGDLAPLAHMAAVMIGEGEAFFQNIRMSGKAALKKAGLSPIVLEAKEGLALINGTQTSTALALAGLFHSYRALCGGLLSGALTTDAVMGSTTPFHPDIHILRGHYGQIVVSQTLEKLLEDSEIREAHLCEDNRVQDPYCIRCQPQVMGACFDILTAAAKTLIVEANAVTDNPLILRNGDVVSGGNFHAEPVAFAADQIALSLCEIGSISQRRIALMVDPAISYGLPAFLAQNAGLNSGFMIAEVTAAALMSENKQMVHPASVDSTPTSANQEDHVSMACHGARRLLVMSENLFTIIGIETLVAVQGIEYRTPFKTSPLLQSVIKHLRAHIKILEEDRYMALDLEKARAFVSEGYLLSVLPETIFPSLAISN
ncbi:Histidine ammonia-lyase [Bartonella clarridgeiae 73]|uniref:Histidine ammonia-lyase n=1 Tax=Bartonella clarridgeiae (strain CCUG 45776 / CIP 104772 / 73) TaxID=696125 RepID=E6YI45_BARC7|nr:histidine ammonia-lyase [Bartonella clarridgeiae]WCR54895.1 MAG: Histidine ammonia-lyase [Bartonella clarridgeiae]CBI76533.1 Histidine ammonia-lyase [Bartonella clarridgeiae 73]